MRPSAWEYPTPAWVGFQSATLGQFSTGGNMALVLGFGPPAARAQVDPGQPSYPALVNEVATLQTQVAALQKLVAQLQSASDMTSGDVSKLKSALATVQSSNALALDPYITVTQDPPTGMKGPFVVFHGVNVQIISGSGSTVDSTGLGNLVIGYDQGSPCPPGSSDADYARIGSHNLILGDCNQFTASGGLVAGFGNDIGGAFASVSGGSPNSASGDDSSVCGGVTNTASGEISSVGGGISNEASGLYASVSGGAGNRAKAYVSSVLGGAVETVDTDYGTYPKP